MELSVIWYNEWSQLPFWGVNGLCFIYIYIYIFYDDAFCCSCSRCSCSRRRRSAASNMGLAGLSPLGAADEPTRRPWCIPANGAEVVVGFFFGFSFFFSLVSGCCCCCCDVREFCVRVRTVNDIPAEVVGVKKVCVTRQALVAVNFYRARLPFLSISNEPL